jgi:hypothetical protein
MTITLGGVTATTAEIAQTLDIMYEAPGNQMRHYLKNTPLAEMDYHQVSKEEIERFPEIWVMPGTKQNHAAHVRPACIHAMERVLAESGWFDVVHRRRRAAAGPARRRQDRPAGDPPRPDRQARQPAHPETRIHHRGARRRGPAAGCSGGRFAR